MPGQRFDEAVDGVGVGLDVDGHACIARRGRGDWSYAGDDARRRFTAGGSHKV